VDEDLGEGDGGAVEGDVALDARAVHRGAQEAPVLVVGLTAEDARSKAERCRPAEVVQHDAAGEGAHRAAALEIAQDRLLVGAEQLGDAVDAIDHHAADADHVERLAAHARSSGGSETHGAPMRSRESSSTRAKAASKRSASAGPSDGVPGATASLAITPMQRSARLRHAMLRLPPASCVASRKASRTERTSSMRSPSPARLTCHARAHSRGKAFAGPDTTPIGMPPRS